MNISMTNKVESCKKSIKRQNGLLEVLIEKLNS